MRILVVLGAGASLDCASGSARTRNEWRPPLANELFNVGKRDDFDPILRRHPGAWFLASELANLEDLGLEQRLHSIANHRDETIRAHYRDVPRYLGDLIATVVHQYTDAPGSYQQLCKKLVSDAAANVVFLTLNYDTYLESALCSYSGRLVFESIRNYCDPTRPVQVFKFHGSINWFIEGVPLPGRRYGAQQFVVPENPEGIVVKNHDFMDPAWFPVLTVPIAAKTMKDVSMPPSHLSLLSQLLRECTSTAFIGTSGFDAHLLDYLRQVMPEQRVVHMVGMGQEINDVTTRITGGVPQLLTGRIMKFDRGFRTYASSTSPVELGAT